MAKPNWDARDIPKKAVPVKAITMGVATAATPHPRYWNTNRPVSISPMVMLPVAIDTSAKTPCSQVYDKVS